MNILSQIVVTPGITNVLLGGVIALQTWLVRRSFEQERMIALLCERLNACNCPASRK